MSGYSGRNLGRMWCARCTTECDRHSYNQKYCADCSTEMDRRRKAPYTKARDVRRAVERSAIVQRGEQISETHRSGLLVSNRRLDTEWLVRVAVPFDWAASKNYIYGLRVGGHVRLRQEVKDYRDLIGFTIKNALRNVRVAQAKLWLDIFVQKPHHRGDAVNFVDTICDAVKRVVGLDDRWYAIRRLDWEIVKLNPKIFIGLSQESATDLAACSSCGRLLPFDRFGRNASTKSGLSKNCFDCSRISQPLPTPQKCEGCGERWADPPSPLCPGCEAYQEHQR